MNKRQLISKIRKEFPELRWKKATHNTEGWDHYVIILDDKYVFRFPRTKEYKDVLRTEFGLLSFLKKSGINIPIPNYQFISHDKTFAGYALIEGNELTERVFKSLPHKVKLKIAKQLADFLTTLHTIPLSKFNSYRVPVHNPKKDYLRLLRDYKKIIRPRISNRDRQAIESFLNELQNHLRFPHSVFVHNDVYSAHILLAPAKNKLSGIIDFADREINDPAIDFCELWLYGKEFVSKVYKYYKGPKDLDFLNRSKIYYKRTSLYVMTAPINDKLRNPFNRGYKLFKKIFYERKSRTS